MMDIENIADSVEENAELLGWEQEARAIRRRAREIKMALEVRQSESEAQLATAQAMPAGPLKDASVAAATERVDSMAKALVSWNKKFK